MRQRGMRGVASGTLRVLGAGPGRGGLAHAERGAAIRGRSLGVGLPARAVVVAVRAKAGDGGFLARKAMIYA